MALTPTDIDALRSLLAEDEAAVRRGDWATVTQLFTADAIRFPAHQRPIVGREAMRVWLETFPPLDQFSITAEEIVGGDGVAFVRGTYAMRTRATPGQPAEEDRGHYLGLVRRQADGSWLWATDMAVSELPATR